MLIDVNAFIGHDPFRRVPGGSPAALLEAMDRTGIDQAWISNLSALFWRDPSEGNAELFQVAEREPRFRAVPAVHPALANWQAVLQEARARQTPCVRTDPRFYGLDPEGKPLRELAVACAEREIPLLLAVRLEDQRQRHPNDSAAPLSPAAVRGLLRAHRDLRLILTHADRDFVEEVHFGSTPAEAARVLWDICWLWGPPEDHLELLLRTVGAERFAFGTGMPLRIPESSVAKLDLLDLTRDTREAISASNAERFSSPVW
jgi:predicted TIM-barrel fold metal-dependent hydrolase